MADFMKNGCVKNVTHCLMLAFSQWNLITSGFEVHL